MQQIDVEGGTEERAYRDWLSLAVALEEGASAASAVQRLKPHIA